MNVRFLFLLTLLPGVAVGAAESQPNFLFIIADDCTFRDLGCYGGQAHTPNIDRLATEGMLFTQCFQAAPMCSPTRHNIYTGLYPVKSGAYPNHAFANRGLHSVVHYLKPLGYRVALSGKRHVAPQTVYPFESSADKNNPDMAAIDTLFSECRKDKTPFCLFACSNEPHSPWNKGDASRYDPATLKLPPYFVDTPQTRESLSHYLAEITYYDGQVGQCLALLDKHGLKENTLVIVVSEQGSGMPFAKWTCYDSGLQSAFIARWPGKIAPGSVSDALIEYIDVLPTFVAAAGAKPDPALQGQSLLPVLFGQTDRHKDFVFGEMTTRGINNGSPHFGIRSVRSAKYKYIINFTPEAKFTNACSRSTIFQSWVRKAKQGDDDAADKVRRYHRRPAEELYAVTKDVYEWHSLAGDPQYAAVKAELKKQLTAWMKAQGDQGQATELAALEHQGPGWKKANNAAKKKAGSGSKKKQQGRKKAKDK